MTLRNKLQALTAPCREADAEIAEALTGKACIWSRPICGYRFADGGAEVPHYTATLDATVDLVEREMPGKNWSVVRFEDSDTITTIGDGDRVIADGKHTLPAVALLLALLEAKEIE
jgi:hypothetical protein